MPRAKAFYEGVEAARNGKVECPYAFGSNESLEWLEGYNKQMTLDIVELQPEMTVEEVERIYAPKTTHPDAGSRNPD